MAALYRGDRMPRSTLVVSSFKPASSRALSSVTESPSSGGPSSVTESPSARGPSSTTASTTESPSSRGPSSTAASTTESPSSRGPSSTTASTTESPSSKVALTTRAKTMAETGSAIVQYTTVPALFQHIARARATKEIITVHGIPSQEFTEFFEQREQREGEGGKFLISLYTADTKCLIITIPTGKHEGLHGDIDDYFRDDAVSMGLKYEFSWVGSTTFKERDANGNITSAGEGDSCRKPGSIRTKEYDYPTLVIEAGWSQTLQELRGKARWWFDKSKGDVKIVLLVKSSPGWDHIRVEKWKLAPAPSRQGATDTRATSDTTPQCVHIIEVSRAAGINNAHPDRFKPESYVVIGGPLRLEFIDIFLRQPIPPRERDLILDNTTLREYAAFFWRKVQ